MNAPRSSPTPGAANGTSIARPADLPDPASIVGEPVDLSLVVPLLRALERKDGHTLAHVWRVTLYTRLLAEKFGLDAATVDRIGRGAALHDVGKLDIPDAILMKPGPLTDAEFQVVKTHPLTGYARLSALGVNDQVALNLVRWHHERIDGKGYPDGLTGDTIPIGPRFFAVIDTFDALTSIRPYRREVGVEAADKAIEELRRGVGTRYCDDAVEAMTRLHASGELDWILEYFNDGSALPDLHGLVGAGRASPLSVHAR